MNNGTLVILPLIVLMPLLMAIAAFVLSKHKRLNAANVVGAVLQIVLSTMLFEAYVGGQWMDHSVDTSLFSHYSVGNWGAPLGIDLSISGFSALMLMLTALVSLFLSIYSSQYFTDRHKASVFWPLWWLLVTGLNGVFVSADAFNVYVCLEVIGLAAAALVAIEPRRAAMEAALRYLLVGLMGSLLYLLGIVLLYRSYGVLDLFQLAELSTGDLSDQAALIFLTTGLMLKMALFPLHFWLPAAHANAPAPVSAILSALVVKAALYVLIMFWFVVLDESVTLVAAQVIGILGGAAILWGSWCALQADRLKEMVAYSTVAQLGYICLLFPLAMDRSTAVSVTSVAMQAAIYFIIAHAVAKAALFLAAGNILFMYGHDRISALKGLVLRAPISVLVIAIAGISLIGLPPSAGFIAKWLLLNAAIDAGQWWWFVTVLIGGLLAAAYLFRVLIIAFDTHQASVIGEQTTRPIPQSMNLSAMALALIAIILGLNAELLLEISGLPVAVAARESG